ncbi:hypothetical protein H0R92_01390 [Treponema sp. OMZ 840]|uniref:hypothetical protein n=1 Tax=Treponema sp. OMZ 840 TaxID=244313 RepID=UPI003D8DC118
MNEAGAWYSETGPENDVVLSTRIRLARNFVNFPFPSCFSRDDGERIQSLVFDAFSRLEHPERYQALSVKKLDSLGQRILSERGVLSSDQITNPVAGIVVRTDGKLMCSVNDEDHLRIACFGAGLNVDEVYPIIKDIDISLQNIVQFAASVEFGYLSASVNNVGTGMKISAFVHLPSLTFLNRETKELSALFSDIEKKSFTVMPCFGYAPDYENSFSPALGACYQISSGACFTGTEEEQIAALTETLQAAAESERMCRHKIADTKPTALRDFVYKALASVKYSRFLTERECIDALFRIKWGKDTGILACIENPVLFALVYRTREAHIEFVNRNERFKFESDINTPELQHARLRSLIMQESLESIQIYA